MKAISDLLVVSNDQIDSRTDTKADQRDEEPQPGATPTRFRQRR